MIRTTTAFVFLLLVAAVSGRPIVPRPRPGIVSAERKNFEEEGFAKGKIPTSFAAPVSVSTSKSIRGGGKAKAVAPPPMTNAQKFMTVSTLYVSAVGLICLYSWETVQKLAPPLADIEASQSLQQMVGSALLGWGVGKFVVSKSSDAVIKTFCQLNLVPILINMYMNVSAGHYYDASILFALGYVYFGYIA